MQTKHKDLVMDISKKFMDALRDSTKRLDDLIASTVDGSFNPDDINHVAVMKAVTSIVKSGRAAQLKMMRTTAEDIHKKASVEFLEHTDAQDLLAQLGVLMAEFKKFRDSVDADDAMIKETVRNHAQRN
jgi:hypothetical protein